MTDKSLVIDDYGIFVGKRSERIVIKKKDEIIQEVPFFKVEQILIASSGVSFSSDLIHECSKVGIQLDFISYRGDHLAKLSSSAMLGTIQTRRQQLAAYQDQRGVQLAIAFARGKIENQIVLLKYLAKSRKSKDKELYDSIYDTIEGLNNNQEELSEIKGAQVDQVRNLILSSEGRAAQKYWQVVKEILPDYLEFSGRTTQHAADLVNSLLNYGYGILYSKVSAAILRAGLDLYAGFLHADRPGKPSLTLDLIEEFRQTVVDRTVIGLLNQGMSFTIEEGRIVDDDRKRLAHKILQ
ncbi:MAG: CRISPR-associated endonuclease Cas1 [Bacillota bacterium]